MWLPKIAWNVHTRLANEMFGFIFFQSKMTKNDISDKLIMTFRCFRKSFASYGQQISTNFTDAQCAHVDTEFVFCFISLSIVAQQFIGFKLKPIQNYQHKKMKSQANDSGREWQWIQMGERVSECVLCCSCYWRIYTAQALHKIRIITIFGYLMKSRSVSQSLLDRILFVWVCVLPFIFRATQTNSNIAWRHRRNVSTKLNFP